MRNQEILKRLDRIEALLSRLVPNEVDAEPADLIAQGVDLVQHLENLAKKYKRKSNGKR